MQSECSQGEEDADLKPTDQLQPINKHRVQNHGFEMDFRGKKDGLCAARDWMTAVDTSVKEG